MSGLWPPPISGPAPLPTPQLEQWNLHGAEDFACTQWDGTIWPVGMGPVPGTKTEMNDTHINCRCTRDKVSGYF